MKKVVASCLILLCFEAFAQSTGPFDAFLNKFLDGSANQVFLVGKAMDSHLLDFYIVGSKGMDGIIFERSASTVVNLFSFIWDPSKNGFMLGDVEGGEQSISRARGILDKIYELDFKVVKGSDLRTLLKE